MEYAATITVNPLTALRMLKDFVQLNPGAPFVFPLSPHPLLASLSSLMALNLYSYPR